jgi:sortase B
MESGGMFGDLDLYKGQSLLREESNRMLILPDRTYSLQVFACLLVSASEERIFTPSIWDKGVRAC